MEINIKMVQDVVVIEMSGDIDSSSAPAAQQKIMSGGLKPGGKAILEMSQVGYMSSAGLRMLLVIYRQMATGGGSVGIVGLSEDIQDTMSLTGFLGFFKLYQTLDEALASI